jgi:hypothetical protein
VWHRAQMGSRITQWGPDVRGQHSRYSRSRGAPRSARPRRWSARRARAPRLFRTSCSPSSPGTFQPSTPHCARNP